MDRVANFMIKENGSTGFIWNVDNDSCSSDVVVINTRYGQEQQDRVDEDGNTR